MLYSFLAFHGKACFLSSSQGKACFNRVFHCISSFLLGSSLVDDAAVLGAPGRAIGISALTAKLEWRYVAVGESALSKFEVDQSAPFAAWDLRRGRRQSRRCLQRGIVAPRRDREGRLAAGRKRRQSRLVKWVLARKLQAEPPRLADDGVARENVAECRRDLRGGLFLGDQLLKLLHPLVRPYGHGRPRLQFYPTPVDMRSPRKPLVFGVRCS